MGGGKYSNIILNAPEGREKNWGIFYRWTKGFIGGPRVFSGFIGGPRVWWTKGFWGPYFTLVKPVGYPEIAIW